MGISDFRGKVVVLAFLDPGCTDVCPLTAFQFRLANQRLGPLAEHLAFLGVNVNPKLNSVGDVAEATAKWGMDTVQGWHYLTGDEGALERVSKAYYVFAAGPKSDKPEEIEHTPGVYIIDRAGKQRWYISVPPADSGWTGPALSDVLQERLVPLLAGAK